MFSFKRGVAFDFQCSFIGIGIGNATGERERALSPGHRNHHDDVAGNQNRNASVVRGRYHTSGGTELGGDSTNALVRGVKYYIEVVTTFLAALTTAIGAASLLT